jgi:hypothetical protein
MSSKDIESLKDKNEATITTLKKQAQDLLDQNNEWLNGSSGLATEDQEKKAKLPEARGKVPKLL